MTILHHVSVINHTSIHEKMFQSSRSNLHIKPSPNLNSYSQSVPNHITRSSRAKVRLFALLIGINTYNQAGFPSLSGAVNDAHRFREYLEAHLAVPSNHITMLTESKATRFAIIKAFQDLEADKRIDKGDAILIYYAGHGTEMDAPPLMKHGTEDKIQAIVPFDLGSLSSDGEVKAIPDCTIGALLSRIADKKGDNITVIFDCCHSASGTRGALASDSSPLVRSAVLPSPEFPADLDQEILNTVTRGACIPNKYSMRGLGSHTLLAACSANQSAKEYRGEGRFSSSLLALLRQVSPEDLRYRDIFSDPRFPVISDHGQTPQCEGLSLDRFLFNGKIQPSRRKHFQIIRYDNDKRCYIVGAGSIQRITTSTTFKVYRKSDVTYSNPIGVLQAKKVEPFLTQAYAPVGNIVIDLEQPVIAVASNPSQAEDLKIRIPQGNGFFSIWESLRNQMPDLRKISVVDSLSDPAHMVVELVQGDQVCFTIHADDGLHELPNVSKSSVHVTNNPTDLHRVLSRAVHFFGELEHGRHTSSETDPFEHINVRFYKLEEQNTASGNWVDSTLRPVDPNLCEDRIITVPITDDETPYGLLITNKSNDDLYVNAFYFDPNILQIQPVIKPNVGHFKTDVPLKKNFGFLAIGFGQGGARPFSFYLTRDKHTEVSFLKLYLTTHPVDLSYLEQESPFEAVSRGMKQPLPRPKEFWTSIVIPIVLRRE